MNWWQLRSVGNLWVLKISYLALAIIPLIAKTSIEGGRIVAVLGLEIWFLSVVFFASLSLALANLLYDIFCPVVVKRFASPNDLYAAMLEIRKVSIELYRGADFRADLKHCTDAYKEYSVSRKPARVACSVAYILSGILFAIIFGHRTFLVGAALVESIIR